MFVKHKHLILGLIDSNVYNQTVQINHKYSNYITDCFYV